jgi:hypothetical protein
VTRREWQTLLADFRIEMQQSGLGEFDIEAASMMLDEPGAGPKSLVLGYLAALEQVLIGRSQRRVVEALGTINGLLDEGGGIRADDFEIVDSATQGDVKAFDLPIGQSLMRLPDLDGIAAQIANLQADLETEEQIP